MFFGHFSDLNAREKYAAVDRPYDRVCAVRAGWLFFASDFRQNDDFGHFRARGGFSGFWGVPPPKSGFLAHFWPFLGDFDHFWSKSGIFEENAGRGRFFQKSDTVARTEIDFSCYRVFLKRKNDHAVFNLVM